MDDAHNTQLPEAQREAHLLAALRPMAATLPESGIMAVINYGHEKAGVVPFWAGEGERQRPPLLLRQPSRRCARATRFIRINAVFRSSGKPWRRMCAAISWRTWTLERVIITGSGMQAIMQTVQALVGPGDEVVVVSPVWPNIFAAIHMQEAVARPVPLQCAQDAWHLDLDRLFDACGPKTRALFLNTPGNPTGWIMEPEDMLRVRDFARARGLWIIVDEVYGQFVYDRPRVTSFLEVMEPDEQLIVVNTFSKNWSMTGWRVGWVVIPHSRVLGQVYENLVQYNTSGVSGVPAIRLRESPDRRRCLPQKPGGAMSAGESPGLRAARNRAAGPAGVAPGGVLSVFPGGRRVR